MASVVMPMSATRISTKTNEVRGISKRNRRTSFRASSPTALKKKRVRELEEEMARLISSASGPNLKAMFNIIDEDNSGHIDKNELQRLLERNNVKIKDMSDLDDLFRMYDTSGNGQISEREFALRYRLDRESFNSFLEIRGEQNEKCGSLPVTLIFFVVYVVLILFHEDTSRVFGLDHGVKNYFTNMIATKNSLKFNNLETVDNVWEWLNEGLVPSVAVASSNPGDQRVARYTVVLGSGLVFEQVRATSKTDEWWNPCNDIYKNPCHASMEISTETYGWPECRDADTGRCIVTPHSVANSSKSWHPVLKTQGKVMEQAKFDASAKAFEPCKVEIGSAQDGYCFKLVTSHGQQDLRSQLEVLRQREWIDLYTNTVRISMYLYNGDLGVYTSVVMSLNFNRGGEVEAVYKSRSIVSDPYGGVKVILFCLDAIWIVMVIWLALTEAKEMSEATKESNKKTCCARYLTYWEDKWNYLDWSQIVLALTVQIMWFKMYLDIRLLVTDKLRLVNENNMTSMGDAKYTNEYQAIYSQLDTTLTQAETYRTIATINLFVLVIRFFKAFGGQPKLAKISSTISMAAVDIIHHMIIMSILFLSFMFAGMFLFGHHVKEWGELDSAVTNTMLIWFSAEMEFEDMFNVSPVMTVVWYSAYILLMVFIVLNLFLAIIIGGYQDAQEQLATGETTLWTQIGNFMRQSLAQRKGSISLEYVSELVNDEKDEDEAPQITIHQILEKWYDDETQHTKGQDKEYAREISNTFLQELVSDFMYYRKQQRKMEEDTQKLIMYNRIRDMDYHFQEVQEKLDQLIGERSVAQTPTNALN